MAILSTTKRLAGALVCVLVFTACGSAADDASGIPTLEDSTDVAAADSSAEVNPEQAAQDFVACLREEGFDVADPTLNDEGGVDMRSIFESSGLDPRSEDFQQVQEACGEFLADAGLGGGAGDRGADRQESLLEFTACLRQEGLEVSDPAAPGEQGDAAGGTPPADRPQQGADGGASEADRTDRIAEMLELDPEDPAVVSAFEACNSVLETLGGPGGQNAAEAQDS